VILKHPQTCFYRSWFARQTGESAIAKWWLNDFSLISVRVLRMMFCGNLWSVTWAFCFKVSNPLDSPKMDQNGKCLFLKENILQASL
jgi:hypothetical protein